MKTLIFFGSPRQNGHTKQMLNLFCHNIEGEYKVIDAYKYYHSDKPISPCCDCRHCWHNDTCSIDDSMSEVYTYLKECNNIVFATPIYFYGIPAPLKIIIDRFQVYWASIKRKDKPTACNKKAVLLMTGGAKAFNSQFDCATTILERVLQDLDALLVGKVLFSNTDNDRLENDSNIYNQIIQIAKNIQ